MKLAKDKIEKTEDYLRQQNYSNDKIKKLAPQEKLLFYENHLSPENKFRGIIEFENMYNIKWINHLCSNQELYNLFMDKFYNKNDKRNSIIEFRKYLIENKKNSGCEPTALQLKKSLNENNYTTLQNEMQELFLEIIDIYYIKELVNKINSGLEIEKLLEWHKKNPTLRFNRALLAL